MTEAGDAPHPLQRFYDDPEWMARYRAGLRAELEALDKSALVDIVLRNRATPPGAEPSEPEKERT